jgi:hypothetical protein
MYQKVIIPARHCECASPRRVVNGVWVKAAVAEAEGGDDRKASSRATKRSIGDAQMGISGDGGIGFRYRQDVPADEDLWAGRSAALRFCWVTLRQGFVRVEWLSGPGQRRQRGGLLDAPIRQAGWLGCV